MSPSSFVSLSFRRNSRRVFIFSSSSVLSWAILAGSLPWCDRSWWPIVTPGIGGTLLVPSSCRVTSRRRIGLQGEVDQVEPEPGLADEVGAVLDVHRRLGVDPGLGLLRPLLGLDQPLLQFPDAGEVLVELFAVVGAEAGLHLRRLIVAPCRGCSARLRSRRAWAWTSSGRPSRNSLANTLDGKASVGTGAPLRVQERPEPSHDRGRLANRVWP